MDELNCEKPTETLCCIEFYYHLEVCRLTTAQVKRCLSWKVHRAKPIIIDPGFYMSKTTDIFWVIERRDSTAFKSFTSFTDSFHLHL
ncbi:hypothetical protein SUGI_0693770 [Cryptomeria japonica]|nr:hypothetical protein SUGI_0693770 [Cryptomeria japonica]